MKYQLNNFSVLKFIDEESLNSFQKNILEKIESFIKKINWSKIKDTSFIEQSENSIDIILVHVEEFMIIMTIEKNALRLNSKYFDYIFFQDQFTLKIIALLNEMFSGQYEVVEHISRKNKMILSELNWLSDELKEFNIKTKSLLFLFNRTYRKDIRRGPNYL